MGVTVFASHGLDFNNFNFNRIYTGAYATALYPDVFLTLHGTTYEDAFEVDWQYGGVAYGSIFGGTGLSATSTGTVTGGTVTGYVQLFWNGSAWEPFWGIEGMSISAVALQQPFLTASTADDYALIQQIMAGSDTILGSGYQDVLSGYGGNDTLRGGGGQDILDGQTGSDSADYSDKSAPIAVTLAGSAYAAVAVGGITEDTIRNIENLVGGSRNDRLTGDDAANRLDSKAGNDSLNGAGGNDTLIGGTGDDALIGGAGKDTLDGSSGADSASYSDKSVSVSVTLNGSAAASVKVNGIIEDTVKNIENLIGGSISDSFTGDSQSNRLEGRAGNDTLKGLAGDDVLVGGLGNDALTGGSGKDQFVFANTPSITSNLDRISDFNVTDDTIVLENAIFKAFSATGPILSGTFYVGTKAHDSSDRIIYNKTTGDLFYDSNGSASGGSVQIVDLSAGLALTYKDFQII